MTSIADGSVKIQTTSESNFSTPGWFGEVGLFGRYLQKHGVLNKINEQVRFARKRFGRYEVLDFLVVLFGYAIGGERTLEEFYERLQPFAIPFMALFERDRLPSRAALSRFLAALAEESVEALTCAGVVYELFFTSLPQREGSPARLEFAQWGCLHSYANSTTTSSATAAALTSHDLRNEMVRKSWDLQITNAQAIDDFLHSKFTNQDLYDWMVEI